MARDDLIVITLEDDDVIMCSCNTTIYADVTSCSVFSILCIALVFTWDALYEVNLKFTVACWIQ